MTRMVGCAMARDDSIGHRQGQHRRLFWRVKHRLAREWWEVPEREVRQYLRMCSWRRAK